jgi:hypothetical protein
MNSTELYNRFISEQAPVAVAATWSGAPQWTPAEARHRLRHGVQIAGAKPAAEMGGLER